MSKTISTIKNEYKLFGIPILKTSQTFYEITTDDNSPTVSDEVILQERIRRIKENEKKKGWFR